MPNVELLKAEVRDQLEKINRLEEEFKPLAPLLDRRKEDVSIYDRAAIGYFLHSLYNGSENIFKTIARFFENDLDPESWHTDLLRRMKLTVEGFRPAVIDEELFLLLDDLRGFRHIFRHSYTFELDWERERLAAGKFERVARLLRQQVSAFLTQIDGIDE